MILSLLELISQRGGHKSNNHNDKCIIISTRVPRLFIGGKDSPFNKWCWEGWISTSKRMKLEPYLIPQKKINSKWIKDVNVRPKTIKLLKENIGGKLYDIEFGNNFLDMTPEAETREVKIDKLDNTKFYKFCASKDTINCVKKPMEWEKYLQIIYLIRS